MLRACQNLGRSFVIVGDQPQLRDLAEKKLLKDGRAGEFGVEKNTTASRQLRNGVGHGRLYLRK